LAVANSALWVTVTTDTSTGAINSVHDSLTPLGGLVPMVNMMTDIVVFGGVGAGLYGILIYCIIAVFIAGFDGRTYTRIPGQETPAEGGQDGNAGDHSDVGQHFLIFSAISSVVPFAKNGYWNPPGAAIANTSNGGPHGFSEILYAYDSATGNNGSAFAGLNGNTPWYNLTLGLAMLIGRFVFLIPILAAAGSLAARRRSRSRVAPFRPTARCLSDCLVGTVIIVAALTYFPAVSLGPIVEHYLMHSRQAVFDDSAALGS